VIKGLSLWIMGLVMLASSAAMALDPDEPLSDPILETRARALSRELRCVVCQNQSIDESDADLAKAMRLLVRERLVAGASDSDVLSALQDRYGDSIRLSPPFKASTYLLWAAPFAFFGAGLWAWRRTFRPLKPDEPTAPSQNKDTCPTPKPNFIVIGITLFCIIGATTLAYISIGHPDLPDQPFRPRLAKKLNVSPAAIADMEAMSAKLTARLEAKPDDGEAWVMLGRANRYLDRQAEAVAALKRGIALGKGSPAILSDLGESLVLRDRNLSPEARAIFAQALLANPGEPRAAFFMASSAAKDGQVKTAISILRHAAGLQAQGSLWQRRLKAQAERLSTLKTITP